LAILLAAPAAAPPARLKLARVPRRTDVDAGGIFCWGASRDGLFGSPALCSPVSDTGDIWCKGAIAAPRNLAAAGVSITFERLSPAPVA